MATSFQLPDLLAIGRAFELRANPHCLQVSRASDVWIQSLGILTPVEQKQAAQTKAGLLVSLCFPTCDVPQLRMMMDFCCLMILAEGRVRSGRNPWDGSSAGRLEGGGTWEEVLQSNVLLRHSIPSLKRLLSKTSSSWRARFSESVRKFRDCQLLLARPNSPYPDVETFIELRRSASGIELIFEMIEPLHDLLYPELVEAPTRRKEEGIALLKKLRQSAGDIVAWSGDIAAHNHNQSLAHSPPTLVFLLMTTRATSLQAAIDQAASLSRQALDVFLETEQILKAGPIPTPPPTPAKSRAGASSHMSRLSGSWSWLFSAETLESEGDSRRSILKRHFHKQSSWWNSTEEEEEVRIYVEALKDCIVGSVNWLYENEVFFGDKADQVKQYGWVFLKPKERADPEQNC